MVRFRFPLQRHGWQPDASIAAFNRYFPRNPFLDIFQVADNPEPCHFPVRNTFRGKRLRRPKVVVTARFPTHRAAGNNYPGLRIFFSSAAVDLRGYRERVRDVVLGLENLPVAMETFSAQSGHPASECMRMAAEADAVICIVAHRYGYVPPLELGGDGERSITWLEVDAAKRAGKPVFPFLIDP
jgi:hypothetical protein